jgi:hypothetical protein
MLMLCRAIRVQVLAYGEDFDVLASYKIFIIDLHKMGLALNG